MAVFKKRNLKYNVFNPDQLTGIYQAPIISQNRAPKTTDLAEMGTIWVDISASNAYIIVNITATAATWQEISDIPSAGTDGQLWIAATGAASAWANLTSTGLSVTITNTANGINLEAAGVAALTTLDGDSGTATPIAGVIDIIGGVNITTLGAAGTLQVTLDDSISLVGAVTAGENFTMSAGTCTITSDDFVGDDIYLHADGGAGETITLHADQGIGTDSVNMLSDVGGITLSAGLAAADSITIDASDAAGGIDIDAGTGGIVVTATDGAISLISGTGAINVGTDAAAHIVTVGSTNTTAQTVVQSGSGDVVVTSTDAVTIDSAGVLELNSSAGVIGIGNDAVAQDINLGTGAAVRIITIGNETGASGTVIECGTGDIEVGTSPTAHNVTVGSTNSTCDTVIQSGTGGVSLDSADAILIDAVGVLELNSSAGVIGIGSDADAQNINIGTGAAARTITVGNSTGATSVVIDAGTGALNVGTNAVAHAVTVGTLTGAGATTIQAGTGDLTIDGRGIVNIDSVGELNIDADGGAINIGSEDDAFAVNIGTGAAARTITIGNATGATSVVLDAGTGAVNIGTNAIAHTTTVGTTTGAADTTIQSGTGGVTIAAAGIVDIVPATDSQAAATSTVNANVGVSTFTGLTTASAASQVFTITNSVCTVGSGILVSASNLGANDAQLTVTRVTPGAGSFTVTLTNNGAAALNGDVIITFWIVAA